MKIIILLSLLIIPLLLNTSYNIAYNPDCTSDELLIVIKKPSAPMFSMNITIGGVFEEAEVAFLIPTNISVSLQLLPTVNPATNVTLIMNIEDGIKFTPTELNVNGQDCIHFMGDFSPNVIKNSNFTIYAPDPKVTERSQLVKVRVAINGTIQSEVLTPEGTQAYGTYRIVLRIPVLDVYGPLEYISYVIPRLRLSSGEITTLSYNITNNGNAALFNISFSCIVPYTLKLVSISDTFVSTLPAYGSYLLEIQVQAMVDYKSFTEFYLYIDTGGAFELRGYPIQVVTYEWFNPWKFDNVVVIFLWPALLLMQIVIFTRIILHARAKKALKKKIANALEEKYGKALIESDF